MWDQRYSEPGYAYGVRENDFLAAVAERIPAGRALCLGEGEGRNAVFLAGLGYEVVAVDSSSVGMAKTRQLAESRRLAPDQGPRVATAGGQGHGGGVRAQTPSLVFELSPDFSFDPIVDPIEPFVPTRRQDVQRL